MGEKYLQPLQFGEERVYILLQKQDLDSAGGIKLCVEAENRLAKTLTLASF